MPGASYSDLKIWQDAIRLVKHVYQLSQHWPASEMYGLTSQLRRAVISVPSNIAEGHGRRSTKEFARFLNIAHGSLMEAETQLIIARELGYITYAQFLETRVMSQELGKMIYGFLRSIEN